MHLSRESQDIQMYEISLNQTSKENRSSDYQGSNSSDLVINDNQNQQSLEDINNNSGSLEHLTVNRNLQSVASNGGSARGPTITTTTV